MSFQGQNWRNSKYKEVNATEICLRQIKDILSAIPVIKYATPIKN